MFARGRLRPDMPEYEVYYRMRPDNKAGDDRTRSLPGLFSPDSEMAEPVAFGSSIGSCVVTEALREQGEGPVAGQKVAKTAEEWTTIVKDLARYHGALNAGVTILQPQHVYSHIGRGVGTWGAEVEPQLRYAIAFTVEMKHDAVSCAPGAPTVMESAQRYVEISTIGVQLAAAIRSWGFPARAHTDGNYRVIAPLVARDAGLGDIGRMGLIMTPQLGPRVRLGVVTTDLPLIPDPPSDDRSMLDFCTICKKCADSCPVSAIPMGDRQDDEGGLRWTLNSEACYRIWAVVGTDCGICMRVCPYSHPANAAHNLVRWAIARSGFARRVLLWMDDFFYGRKPEPREGPPTGVP
jgi:reductive dehalogenase